MQPRRGVWRPGRRKLRLGGPASFHVCGLLCNLTHIVENLESRRCVLPVGLHINHVWWSTVDLDIDQFFYLLINLFSLS